MPADMISPNSQIARHGGLLRRLGGASVLLAVIASIGTGRARAGAPEFTLQGVPLSSGAEVKTAKAGAVLSDGYGPSKLYEVRANRDTTTATGVWNGLGGTIRIERAAKGDRQTWPDRLNDPSALFDTNPVTTTYLITRISRQSFPWGEAVTALTQESQLDYYSPNNEMLSYKVCGMTSDGKYLISARFAVTLVGLPATWKKARDWGDDAKKAAGDPDVRRLNAAPAGSFSPSLQAIDNLLGTLAERGKSTKRSAHAEGRQSNPDILPRP
jgi:hypothetical protein